MKIITMEYLLAHRPATGSWTKDQMKILGKVLGIKSPSYSGWRDAVVGKKLTDEHAAIFELSKFLVSNQTLARQAKREITVKARSEPPSVQKSLRRAIRNDETKKAILTLKAERRTVQKLIAQKVPKQAIEAQARQAPARLPDGIDPNSPGFLMSYEWRTLRMQALIKHGARCQCCGASPATGAVMNVDHIKPRRLFPHLALELSNLQTLCQDCNAGKGNWDQTDWRKTSAGTFKRPLR